MPRSRLRDAVLHYGVARGFAAFGRRDWEMNTAFFDPVDYEFRAGELASKIPGLPDHVRGVDGYLRVMADWIDGWSDIRVQLEKVVDARPDRLVALVRFTGRGERSGLRIDQQALNVVEIRAGRVVSQDYWWNVDAGLRSAGLTPSAGPK